MVPGTHPGPAPWKIRDPHSSSRERLRKTNPQVSPLNTRKQGEERPQRQMPKWTLSHKSAHKACPARYRPRPADILRQYADLLYVLSVSAQASVKARVDPLRDVEKIAADKGMDFEQALKVHQGRMAGACDRPGAFLPCLRQGSPWRRWPFPREGQGLALAQSRYQGSNSAQPYPGSCPSCDWPLAHSKWTMPQAVAKESMKVA